VNVRRPSAGRNPTLPQGRDGAVQGVRYGCQIELAILEDVRVHALGDERPVDVVHGPIKHLSIRKRRALPSDSPESGDDALEPDIQHGGGDVDSLIWLVRIYRCRFTSTEIGEPAAWDVKAHEMA
jgi:hypothetical protein